MEKCLIIFVIAAALTSCNNAEHRKIVRKGEPDIVQIPKEDVQMNAAIIKANSSLKQFDEALKSHNPNFTSFSLKARYDVPSGGEHIWVSNIRVINGNYFGRVANVPDEINGLKLGDSVRVDKEKISDWMYIDSGKLCGGYTIRALRNQMNEKERRDFDLSRGYIIED
jgi:uncharacterized protein YegJ (DUF2314 family)